MYPRFLRHVLWAIAILPPASGLNAEEIDTSFTYQGQLKEGGRPLEGPTDFRFTLWDDAVEGTQVGGVQAINALPVIAGLFTVTLNAGGEFGVDAFNGNTRWVEVAVRFSDGKSGFTTLTPRQPITATPYALRASLGVGPPGVLDLTPTGQLFLTQHPGTGKASHLSFDADNWTMAAFSDIVIAPMTVESRSPNGDKTQILIDNASSSVTIAGQLAPEHTAGITPPPKLRINLLAAEANTAGAAAEAGVTIAAYEADGETAASLRLKSGDLNTMSVTPTGKVGIGTDVPTASLHIGGAPGGTNGIRFPDGTLQTTAATGGGGGAGIASQNPGGVFVLTLDSTAVMQDVQTVTITAPADGYIVVDGKCYAQFFGVISAGEPNTALVQIDADSGGDFVHPYVVEVGTWSHGSPNSEHFPVYVTRVFPVTAGTYTYRLEARRGSFSAITGSIARINNPIVTAVYYPTSYGMVSPFVAASQGDGGTIVIANSDAERNPWDVDPVRYFNSGFTELTSVVSRLQTENQELQARDIAKDQRINELEARLAALEASFGRPSDSNNEGAR